MKLNPLNVGDLKAEIPLIQGGMGIGVSRSKLAAAVANEGGIGIISGVAIGFLEPDFNTNPRKANLTALKKEIDKARILSPNGIIGINFLCAMNNYDEMVKAAVEDGIDIIVSGAGLPSNLPELVSGYNTKIAPIVSSSRATRIILKVWDIKYNRTADMVIVEGPKAGGHLGFSNEELINGNEPDLLEILKDVIEEVKPFEEKYNKKIPIIAAGGIFTGSDIAKYLNAGADGVQISTRFVATNECDASDEFKQAYVDTKEDDIKIINSPVGMPGRAINNEFVKKNSICKERIDGCSLCLKGCNPNVAPYCISKVLIESVKGNTKDGLIFVGSNAYRVNEIVSVKELVDELMNEARGILN